MQSILIVEDYREARAAMVDILMDDYETSEASCVAEAVAAVKTKPVDLLLSDVRMEGPDGIEGLEQIRQLLPDIRAILITGFASDEAPSRAIKLRVDDYLYKPFRRMDLVNTVERVLGSSAERAKYQEMLDKVIPPETGQEASVIAALDALRDSAWGAFYVGVRSRKLLEPSALGAWERLELLEKNRLEPTVDRAAYQELVRGYNYLLTQVGHIDQSQTQVLERLLNTVDPEVFGKFYTRLQSGELTSEQARVAPTLRRLEPAQLDEATRALRTVIWG